MQAARFAARAQPHITPRMEAPFLKMHGAGNDFVVFDEREAPLGLTPARAAAIANRRTGVGCDQFIVIEPPPAGSRADAFMRIRNPDGSEAGACGNATRCVVSLLAAESGRADITIQTISGLLPSRLLPDGRVQVDMGPARLSWHEIPLAQEAAACSMGNPHATFFVPDVMALPIESLGPALETDPLFPQKANIGFAEIQSPTRIRLRVWERAAGLTLACGSGACATIVNAARRGLTGRRATIEADGGLLDMEWREDNHVLMTGPVTTSFRGTIDLACYPA
jgi:diaminopimelate epimerase